MDKRKAGPVSVEDKIAGERDGPGQGGATRPTCPFCGAGWTAAMLDQYDALVDPEGCACCGAASHGHDHGAAPRALPVPTGDLCCEHCGRAIFRAPASLSSPSRSG